MNAVVVGIVSRDRNTMWQQGHIKEKKNPKITNPQNYV